MLHSYHSTDCHDSVKTRQGERQNPRSLQDCKQVLRVVTTDVTQMTTLPSACKGLSSYAIAPLTQAWANAEIFQKALFLERLLHKRRSRLFLLLDRQSFRCGGSSRGNRERSSFAWLMSSTSFSGKMP